MSATNSTGTGNGKKNYYSVSYGKLSTRVKEVPEGATEIVEADLKSRVQAVEQIDLRNKYVNKAKGDYPYLVFFDSITGVITAYEKYVGEDNTNLNLTLIDSDGDTSILQMKFYSKYAENLLNRLLNTTNDEPLTFFPYQIPSSAEIEGKQKEFYNQGVSLKKGGVKIEPKYKHDNPELPKTEQVKVQGKMTTSRDSRLDFLFTQFEAQFKPNTDAPAPSAPAAEKAELPKATPEQAFDPAKSFTADNPKVDLPFG